MTTDPCSPGSRPSKPPFAFALRTWMARRVMRAGLGLAAWIVPWVAEGNP